MVCARECLEARAYRDAITHTLKASELCQVQVRRYLMTDVLFCQKEAWCGLGNPTGYYKTVKIIAQHPTLPGHARVLCEAWPRR